MERAHPIEKRFARPAKIEQQVATTLQTTRGAVDLHRDDHLAVCTIQTVEGTCLSTRFSGQGRERSGTRREPVRTHCTHPQTDGHHC
jgi:putative transposase